MTCFIHLFFLFIAESSFIRIFQAGCA